MRPRKDDAIVQPGGGRPGPNVGDRALLIGNQADAKRIWQELGWVDAPKIPMLMSRRCTDGPDGDRYSVVSPFLGGAYAVMLAELLWAWGVETLYVLGWCGSLGTDMAPGDIVVPIGAWIDEGVSAHYATDHDPNLPTAYIHAPLGDAKRGLQAALDASDLTYRCVPIWSTDAIYRETPDRIAHFQNLGAQAVEMEMAALFSAAHYRRMDIAAVLIVSDSVSTSGWQPGFGAAAFKFARGQIAAMLANLIKSS